jgi:hypothetical protein
MRVSFGLITVSVLALAGGLGAQRGQPPVRSLVTIYTVADASYELRAQ